MTRRMYTMSTVHFQARANEEQHAKIMVAVGQSGLPQDAVVVTVREMLLHAARMGAAAQLREMEQWTPERWRQECGVRIANALGSDADGPD